MKQLIVIMIALFIPFMVSAAEPEVTSVDATIDGNNINVAGTTDEGMLAVAITVYDESGEDLVSMQTAPVDEDNTFADNITVPTNGKYIVKVANYDGGAYLTKTVGTSSNNNESTTPNKTTKASNPKTSDEIIKYVLLTLIALGGIVTSTILLSRKKQTN